MQTKEIASLLNCDNRRLCERLKYYKKQGVFKPEGTVVKGKTDYTMKDLDSIKELEVLTKSGISCGNIKKIQVGECSLDYIIADTITSLNNQIERAKSSIALLQMMSDDNVQFNSTLFLQINTGHMFLRKRTPVKSLWILTMSTIQLNF